MDYMRATEQLPTLVKVGMGRIIPTTTVGSATVLGLSVVPLGLEDRGTVGPEVFMQTVDLLSEAAGLSAYIREGVDPSAWALLPR